MEPYEINVFRLNPAAAKKESYDIHTFNYDHHPTILEVLRKIRDERDVSLAFRESCGLGKCGSCAVMMNGNPVLACQTPVAPGKSVLEPLRNHGIIKDLVVERTDFHDRLREMRAFYAKPDYLRIQHQPFQWDKQFQVLNRCIECLICESTCPALELSEAEFPGPALLVQLSRFLNHPFARGTEAHIAWVDGIHNCTACMNCTRVCPKEIDPFRNAVLPLRTAISDQALELPKMQQGLSDQYAQSGRVVPVKHKQFAHPAIDAKSRTAMFLGCMLSDRYPEEAVMVLDLLVAMGIRVKVPEDMVCCGGPLMWVGKTADGKEAFERNLEILIDADIKQVITPCTGCSLTLKEDYSDLYRQETGNELPFAVADITEILNDKIHEIDFNTDRSIRTVFHLPCHHGKGQVQLEKLLENQKIPGIDMIEGTDRCCGGMTASSNPSTAHYMSSKIVETAESLQADILATACIFCRDNLMRAARRNKSKLKVENILLLLAKNLSKGDKIDE